MPAAKSPIERIASNTLMLAVARMSMALALPLFGIAAGFIGSESQAIANTDRRVTVLETRADIIGRQRDQFQQDTLSSLQRMEVTDTEVLKSLSAIIARLDEKDRK